MTKRQRVLERVRYIKRTIVLGALRTTALTALKRKYGISENVLRKWCLSYGGGGADYWT